MLLSDDVGVVEGLDAGLDGEGVASVLLGVHVLHADLVVARDESCEVVPHFLLIAECLEFLSFGVRDGEGQTSALRLDLDDSCVTRKKQIVSNPVETLLLLVSTYLEWSRRYSQGSTGCHLQQSPRRSRGAQPAPPPW